MIGGAAGPTPPRECLRAVGTLCERLDLHATPDQLNQLKAYVELLLRWSRTYNLTAVRDVDAFLVQHLADCLAVVPPLRRCRSSGRLLDVGSGGGLPGVVIAIAMPEMRVACVDAVGKKAAFIRHCAGALGLPNLTAHHARVERVVGLHDIITSRAFSSLTDLVRLTAPLLASGGIWMAMKGRVPLDEIEQVKTRGVDVFHVEPLTVPDLQAERCLVWMRPAQDTAANPSN